MRFSGFPDKITCSYLNSSIFCSHSLSLSNYNEMIFLTKILTISLFTLAYRGGRSIFGSNKSPDPTVSESIFKE